MPSVHDIIAIGGDRMKFHNYNDADKTYLGIAVAFFILGLGSKFYWIPAVLFLLVAFLKD